MRPEFSELAPELQRVLDPARPKALAMIAKGAAPLPPPVLIQAWCYLAGDSDAEISKAATQSLQTYPEKMLLPILSGEIPGWALQHIGQKFSANENILEPILLNEATPDIFFIDIAKTCSEKITVLIANNQERIIQAPDIVKSLESNPENLKSNTDRLRHFLQLAGISIPGEAEIVETDVPPPKSPSETAPESTSAEAKPEEEPGWDAGDTSEETQKKRQSLQQFILNLNVGGRVKLAQKGNKECRYILIRDTNRIVAMAVLKSPKLTENEIAHYASLRNVSDDVIRTIANTVTWTKQYHVKLALCFHPKTPLQNSMQFIKFLNMRDLTKLAREKNVPGPLQKASKELLSIKRK